VQPFPWNTCTSVHVSMHAGCLPVHCPPPQALKEDSQKLDGLSLMEEMKENSKEQMDANFQSDVAKTKNIYWNQIFF